MRQNNQISFYEKYLLTVDEAAIYFNIGSKKIYELVHLHPNVKWYLLNGKRILIKKDLFAKWLDQQNEI